MPKVELKPLTPEAQALAARVAEVMRTACAQPGQPVTIPADLMRAIDDSVRKASEPAIIARRRMEWLHSRDAMNVDGYEWGIFRVKWENGRAVEVQRVRADHADLDAAMRDATPTLTAPSRASPPPPGALPMIDKPTIEGLMELVTAHARNVTDNALGIGTITACWDSVEAIRTYATSLCAPSVEPVRYDVLHEIAATFNLDYNAVCRAARSAASPSAPQPAEGLTEIGWVLVKGADNEYGLEARPYLGTELLELPLGRHPIYIRKAALSAAPQPVAVEPLTEKEDAALLWLGSVRDDFRRMADEANNLLTQACSRIASSSPQKGGDGEGTSGVKEDSNGIV